MAGRAQLLGPSPTPPRPTPVPPYQLPQPAGRAPVLGVLIGTAGTWGGGGGGGKKGLDYQMTLAGSLPPPRLHQARARAPGSPEAGRRQEGACSQSLSFPICHCG